MRSPTAITLGIVILLLSPEALFSQDTLINYQQRLKTTLKSDGKHIEDFIIQIMPKRVHKDREKFAPESPAPRHIMIKIIERLPPYAPPDHKIYNDETCILIVPTHDESVSNYASNYPDIAKCIQIFNKPINALSTQPAIFTDISSWVFTDGAQTIHSKYKIFKSDWLLGIQFLTALMQDYVEITNTNLCFHFIGLTRDGNYLITMRIPIMNPVLPFIGPNPLTSTEADWRSYYLASEQRLNQASDDSFFPTISSIVSLINSIREK